MADEGTSFDPNQVLQIVIHRLKAMVDELVLLKQLLEEIRGMSGKTHTN